MKLRCAVFLRLVLQGVKIFWNVSKVCMHACSSNGHQNSSSNLNSKKLLEIETPSCGFDGVGLKGGKIAPNVMKVGVHTCLSNMHPKL